MQWTRTTSRVASWLAYSEEHDALLASNKDGISVWRGRDGKELWSKESTGNGFKGHPENYWDKVILWKDRIIDQRGPGRAYSLLTGRPVLHPHPITGEEVPWEFTKTGHHCNYAVANEHLMTFRAASAGYCDLASGGTGRLQGFRSLCRNSLIPANGVLNAPNFAHGCICSYSIFTSLALVNVPETNLWTYSAYRAGDGPVERLGINFGAPGDRQDEDGTLWLDYPNAGGPSPNLPIKITTKEPEWFRLHTSQISGDEPTWVAASGVKGVQSVTIPLVTGKRPAAERSYTVRLHFVLPAASEPSVFDVTIQEKPVLEGFDLLAEAGGERTAIVKEFRHVRAVGSISVGLSAIRGRTVMCGVEVVTEGDVN